MAVMSEKKRTARVHLHKRRKMAITATKSFLVVWLLSIFFRGGYLGRYNHFVVSGAAVMYIHQSFPKDNPHWQLGRNKEGISFVPDLWTTPRIFAVSLPLWIPSAVVGCAALGGRNRQIPTRKRAGKTTH